MMRKKSGESRFFVLVVNCCKIRHDRGIIVDLNIVPVPIFRRQFKCRRRNGARVGDWLGKDIQRIRTACNRQKIERRRVVKIHDRFHQRDRVYEQAENRPASESEAVCKKGMAGRGYKNGERKENDRHEQKKL